MPSRRRLPGIAAAAVAAALALLGSPNLRAQDFTLDLAGKSPGAGDVTPLTISARFDRAALAPDDHAALAVILQFAPHWHAWPAAPRTDAEGRPLEPEVLPPEVADFAIRTEIELLDAPDWIVGVGDIQWPTPRPAPVPDIMNPGRSIEVPVYQGRSIAYIPVLLSSELEPGEQAVQVEVRYQACDETSCRIPESLTARATVRLVAGIEQASSINTADADPDFAGFDPAVFASMAAPSGGSPAPAITVSPGSAFFGFEIPRPEGLVGALLLALLAAVGGFILNLTPCVLPVIPIKIMTISQHAGSPGRSLYLGLWMAAGVIGFWIVLGIIAASFSAWADPSRVFGLWWFTLSIGLLIGIMGVGIMGVFTLQLPQTIYKLNPRADSATGSFLFGVMTAVLGLPCFGFVAGALLAGSAALPSAVILTIFAGIGIGMAAPYLVLSARPSLVKKLPRTGPGSDLIKQVMGLLLMAAAVFFIGSGLIALVAEMPWMSRQLHWWGVAALATLAGAWMIVRTFQISRSIPVRVGTSLIALLFAGVALAYAYDSTSRARANWAPPVASSEFATDRWIDFSPQRLDAALESGHVVVIDFTAEWCLNCKALKTGVLQRGRVRQQLLADDTVALVADVTSTKAPGWTKLRELGQTGIPLLVIYGPGLETPWQSNAYTSDQVLDALQLARGGDSLASRTGASRTPSGD